jgi:hypothetical protein
MAALLVRIVHRVVQLVIVPHRLRVQCANNYDIRVLRNARNDRVEKRVRLELRHELIKIGLSYLLF